MTEKKLKKKNSEPLNIEGNSPLRELYEAAEQLTLEEKAHLIRRLIDTSKMNLSLRVEMSGSAKMTILNFDLDKCERAIQIEEAACNGDQIVDKNRD